MSDIHEILRREAGLPRVFGGYQLAMVAVGAIISYGLLSGAAYPLSLAGPGVVVSYLAASVVVLLVTYCLSEMASRHAMPGAFGSYAESYLGACAGFMVRSAYVVGVLLIIGTEVALLGQAVSSVLPGVSARWVAGTGLLALVLLNLLSARWFARLECVLSTIKVAALLFFLFLAWRFVYQTDASFVLPQDRYESWGLLRGSGVWEAFVLAVLGYAGMESLAIAAGETARDARSLRRVIRMASMWIAALVMAVVLSSVVLGMLGVLPVVVPPAVFLLLHSGLSNSVFMILVAIAVLSVVNSQLYSASRMLFSLGRAEPRLRWLGLSHGESPRVAVLCAGVVSLLVYVALQRYAYQTFLAATTIAASCWLLVWIMVFFSFLRFRKTAGPVAAGDRPLRAWPAWLGAFLVLGVALSTWELALFDMTLKIGLPFLAALWLVHRLCIRMR